jgi:hypothetical protein
MADRYNTLPGRPQPPILTSNRAFLTRTNRTSRLVEKLVPGSPRAHARGTLFGYAPVRRQAPGLWGCSDLVKSKLIKRDRASSPALAHGSVLNLPQAPGGEVVSGRLAKHADHATTVPTGNHAVIHAALRARRLPPLRLLHPRLQSLQDLEAPSPQPKQIRPLLTLTKDNFNGELNAAHGGGSVG